MFQAFDENYWGPKGRELMHQYRDAQPFSHISLAPFLVPEAAEMLVAEFPKVDDPIWNHYHHFNCHKMATNDREEFPEIVTQVIDELSSPKFVSWLSDLVDVPNLVPDPKLEGAGLHQINGKGYLNIHADFTYHHHNNRLRRRVNLLLYLNQEWEDDWGGELELWDEDVKRCVAKYPPLYNQAIIFSTSENTWHGHPQPLNFPPGMGRKSIALYYYTLEAEPGDRMRATLFRALPGTGMIARLTMRLDQIAINIYTSVKQIFGIKNDNKVTIILKWIGKLISRPTGRK